MKEKADVVGLSILSGAHMELFPQIIEGLHERGMNKVIVVAGGIIPDLDKPALEKLGVRAIFGPGTPMSEIASFIRCAVDMDD